MNSFDRIMGTITGEPIDRKAYTEVLSQYGLNYCGASNQEYYQNPEVYACGQKAIYEYFSPDVLFGPFALAMIGKAFGAELKYYPDRPPVVKKPGIKSVEELIELGYPDLNQQTELVYLRQCIQLLSAHFHQKVPVAAISLNPMDIPIMIYGMEKWLEYFLMDKAAFYKTLEFIIPFFVQYTNSLISDGAACVIMPTVFGNSGFVNLQQTVEIINPVLKSAFSQINGALVMHHGGLPFLPYLDTYKDFPSNVIGFGMDWKDDYHKARAIIGPDKLIFFGIDGPSLYTKEKARIIEECKRILVATENDPKHVIYTCSSDILVQTSQDKILAMSEAVNEHYPQTVTLR